MTVALESPAVSDLPPADWYTDPEDESLYRYWDGSAWTEHRAPRHADPIGDQGADPNVMRSPVALLGDTFSIARRQWRGCGLAAVISLVAQVVIVVLIVITADAVVMGELSEILNRVFDPDRFDSSDTEAYFESLEFNLSPINLLPAALAVLILWAVSNMAKAAVTRLALADLNRRSLSVSDAFKQGLVRVPRLMGLDAQLLIITTAAVTAIVAAATAPLLLVLVIPALVAGAFYAIPVTSVAYVMAAAGPAGWSLLHAARLVRGRFWGALVRMLLVIAVIVASSTVIGASLGAAQVMAGLDFQLAQVIQTVLSAALAILGWVAPAILYRDLGGESNLA